jgi:hypothetical protein
MIGTTRQHIAHAASHQWREAPKLNQTGKLFVIIGRYTYSPRSTSPRR